MAGSESLLGQSVSHYRIIDELGGGGMGVVYKAEDTELGRFVALKFLPDDLCQNPIALERFRREARAASTLNHPNICTIYEIGRDGNRSYIAMEHLEGHTLRHCLQTKPLPLDRVVDWGIQISEGLEAAHASGIVHRDIKPANIFITRRGHTKILDFGLAKVTGGGGEDERTVSANATAEVSEEHLTTPGMALGTIAYMSPEQARGEELDARSDLFSLGIVLYQMCTGRLPFGGSTTAVIFDGILHQPPMPMRQINPNLPAGLEPIVTKALEKDRDFRYQSAAELRADLKRLRRDTESTTRAVATKEPRKARNWAYVAVGVGLVAGIALTAVIFFRNKETSNPAGREWVQLTNFADSAVAPAVSPDGHVLAFIRGSDTFFGAGDIYVKLLPDGEPARLTHDGMMKMSPQFSPDGSRIAYTAFGKWDTWSVPTLGGQARPMLSNASGLTWIDRQHLLFSEIKGGMHMGLVTATDGRTESRDIYLPARERGMAHRSAISPDHKWVLLAEMDNGGWRPCRLVPFDGSSTGKIVGPPGAGCTYAGWSPEGTQMFLNSDEGGRFHIWRQAFKDGKLEQLTSGPTEEEGIAITADGHSLITSVGLAQSTLWLHDSKGERQISSEGYAEAPRFSSDGRKLYYLIRRRGPSAAFVKGELWVADLSAETNDRLLQGFAVTGYDISPDGKRVAFSAADRAGRSHLWVADIDLGSSPREIPSRASLDEPRYDANGRIYARAAEGNSNFLYRVMEDGGMEKLLPQAIFEVRSVAPSGRWAALELSLELSKEGSLGFHTAAYEIGSGKTVTICNLYCPTEWVPGGHFFQASSGGVHGQTKTVLLPIPPGKDLPELPPNGIEVTNDVLKLRGAKVLDGEVTFGPSPDLYAETRRSAHRNLYLIPLN